MLLFPTLITSGIQVDYNKWTELDYKTAEEFDKKFKKRSDEEGIDF